MKRTPLKRKTPLRPKSKKRIRYESELNRMRKLVKERDRERCVLCGGRYSEIHHIKFRSSGGTNELSNLCCLCWHCHHEQAHGPNAKEIRKLLESIVQKKR